MQGITPDIAASLGLSGARGALVSSVQPRGPAATAGIERGDVITAIDGHSVDTSNDLRNRIAASKPGSSVKLDVVRDGKERTVSATLSELPSSGQARGEDGEAAQGGGSLGLGVEPLSRERARALGLKEGEGLEIVSVAPSSPAADAGFQRGDVIEEVNGKALRGVAELRDAAAAATRPLLLLVRRGEQSIYLTIAPRQ